GYPCIVGGGPNAAILHYNTNQERLDDNTLLLMDCAAEFDHYTADITRTIPINGKFSKEQADIYRVVYEAQEECFKLIAKHREQKVTVAMVNARAREVVADGLLRLGLITSKNGDEARTWFMHGTSHWLGMNVHDVGDYNTPLAPGMIFTVEPGIYLRPDALEVMPKTSQNEKFAAAIRAAFEKYKGIGVRIEDDILITPDGYRNMSQSIPRKLEEVETTMAKLKRELKQSGWPSVAAR
ncbi:MAG: M24 family metallopeptidase, partial [Acidobacteriota bacterium]